MKLWPGLNTETRSPEKVVLSERPRLYRLALAITSSHDIAEDVVQETICRFLQSEESIRDAGPWLRRVLIRCAVASQGDPRRAELPEEIIANSPFPDESLAVAETLRSLSPEHRTILALALLEQLSYSQIAHALDIPMGSVASRLHAAKREFRRRWEA